MRKLALMLIACCLCIVQVWAQNKTVSGRVANESGNPIAGASVTVKGNSKVGTVTSPSGTFTLSVPGSATTLTVSYAGFTTQELVIGATNNVSAVLVAANTSLDDVIVTGLTSVKRSQYAGAATVVTRDKINDVPVASFDQLLQGRAPGLLVTVGSGQPGAAARVQIRGASSISGGNSPLYVVDGMPIENETFQGLNPNDFEDIQVLRDASATALYGNRGAAGVIVITTKKGKTGKPTLNYNYQYGVTEPGTQKFEMMNSAELLKFQETLGLLTGTGTTQPGFLYSPLNPANRGLTPAQLATNARTLDSIRNINTNWQDVFMRKGNFQRHDLNLSGGGGNTRYFVGAGYYDEDGIGLRSDLKRYTLRANLDIRTDKLIASFNNSIGYTHRNFIESENGVALANPFAAAYLALPYQTLFLPNGNVNTGSGKVGPNAYDRVNNTTQLSDQLKANLAYKADYYITKNVFVGGFAGLDYRQTTSERSIYPGSYAANTAGFPIGPDPTTGQTTGRGSYGRGFTNFLQYVVRANAGFKKIFADKHDVNITAITEYTDEKESSFGYTGYGISPKLLNTPAGITAGTVDNRLIPGVSGGKTGRRLFAGILTGVYTFDQKYTLNATIRRDASTQLLPAQQWVTFGSVGATWNVLKEGFTNNWSKVSDLRVRASYGTSANADGFYFGNFGNRALYSGSGSYAGVYPITAIANAGNPDVTWEIIKTANVGIDFGFFRGRLTGSADVYHKKTTGNIIGQQLPAESGLGLGASIPVNAGVVVNKGAELNLNASILSFKNFDLSIGGNIAYNHNEVTDLGQVQEFEQGTELIKVGKPLGTHYIVKWGGVDAATGSPLYYNAAGKLTNVYSDDYRVSEFGTYNAPWIGGYNTTIRYKGFTASAFFTFQQGFSRFNNQDYFQLNHAFAVQGFNLRREMLTMWTAPGNVTDIQSPLYQRQFVSKDIQDASFTRFRNLNVSYSFGPKVLRSLKVVSNLNVYIQAQNLYTWTNWTGFDPEDNDNIAQYEYPTPRTLTFGVQVGLK